jgi:hypothetical protein
MQISEVGITYITSESKMTSATPNMYAWSACVPFIAVHFIFVVFVIDGSMNCSLIS